MTNQIQIGSMVRSYDFRPREGVDYYVEGEVTNIDGESVTIKVTKDTMLDEGSRTEVITSMPNQAPFDWAERITVIN